MLSLMPQCAAAQEPPKFLIEAIRVAGVQRAATRQIVADESLLKPGQTYSEQQLRLAVYRVKRLSFIIDAEFSLEKGSERGAYELVITVEEQKPLFFLAQATGARYRDSATRPFYGIHWQEAASLGGRYFIGSHGLVFGSVDKYNDFDGEVLQAGYTQYDVFGKGSFASLLVGTREGLRGHEFHQASLDTGIPLTSTQSLRANLSWNKQRDFQSDAFDRGDGILIETTAENRVSTLGAALSWIYDTTDNPLFPTSGTRLSGMASRYRARINNRYTSTGSDDFVDQGTFNPTGALLSAWHYVPLSPQQSLILGLDTNYSRYQTFIGPNHTYQTGVAFGHTLSLLGLADTDRFGDLRWENRIEVLSTSFSGFYSQTATTAKLISALTYRNPWGLLRVSFTYDNLWSDQ